MKRKKVRILSIVLALAMTLALAACGGGGSTPAPAPSPAGSADPAAPAAPADGPVVINIGRGSDTVTMDPIFAGDNVDIWLMNLVFEGLVKSSADGKTIEPCLATSWDLSDDQLTYTFHLREGVKFSDGKAVTGEDWVYSITRSIEKGSWSSMLASIDTVTAPDDKTVVIQLKNPSGAILSGLAGFFSVVTPKDYYSTADDDTLANTPIGTGPFVLEKWEKDVVMTFKKNPNYWDEGYPYADEINFRVVPDTNTRAMQLMSGTLDMITGVDAQAETLLKSDSSIQLLDFESTHVNYISMNTTSDKLKDPRVRQALNYATDKDAIIQSVYAGVGTRTNSVIWPAAPHYNKDAKYYDYDVEKAKSLLAEAGQSDLELNLIIIANDGEDLMMATILQDQWKKAGITLNITQMDSPSRREERNNLTFEILLNYVTSDISDTSEIFELFCIYDNFDCWHTGWHDEKQQEAEKLVKEAGATSDEAKRTELYYKAQTIMCDEALLIPLNCVPATIAARNNITGVVQTPLGNYLFNELTKTA